MHFLLQYPPDLNLTEKVFSKLKAYLRSPAARTFGALNEAVGEICTLYEATESWNYFKAIGYWPD